MATKTKTVVPQHTPGPWKLGYGGNTVSTDPGDLMAQLNAGKSVTVRRVCDCRNDNYMTTDEVAANARRIVACVNALRDLPTDVLELIGSFDHPLIRLQNLKMATEYAGNVLANNAAPGEVEELLGEADRTGKLLGLAILPWIKSNRVTTP